MNSDKLICSAMAVLLISMAGCGAKINKQDTASVSATPAVTAEAAQDSSSQEVDFDSMYHSTDSLDSAESEAGFDMTVPDTVKGSTACQYYVANDNSTIRARYVDDNKVTMLMVDKSNQIGGSAKDKAVYETEKTIPVNDTPVTFCENGNLAYAAEWVKDSYSYTIHTDTGMPEGDLMAVVFEVS